MTDHNHMTRDIKPVGVCPACDLSRDEVASGYITDAMVEKAAQALHDHRSMECRALHEVGQPLRDSVYDNERRADARAALEAVVPAIVQAAKVEALREAAQKYQWGGWAERNPAIHADLASRRRQAEHAVAWLRTRAGHEQGARP